MPQDTLSSEPRPAPAADPADPAAPGAGASAAAAGPWRIAAVAIGRNEGERLRRCLRSLVHGPGGGLAPVVYVDSGSTDDSVAFARSLGVEVVELDTSRPFTAANARNAGYRHATDRAAGPLDAVLFVDGDCELLPGWLDRAAGLLRERPDVAAVGGPLHERHPEASPYNRMAAMEWQREDDGPAEAESFAGNGLVRCAAFDAAGGYDASLIAGEEPELCVRFRLAGRRILMTGPELAVHDAATHRFGQWWRRSERSGHAFAEGYLMHGRGPTRFRAGQLRSVLVYGLLLPAVIVAAAVAAAGLGWAGLPGPGPSAGAAVVAGAGALVYPLQVLRIARHRRGFGNPWRDALLYGTLTMVGKLAQALGVVKFAWLRARGRRRGLIEYK